jgi:hypothetical protein
MAYGSALDVWSCPKREGSWTFARVSVRTYACACGPGMGHTTWRMGLHGTGELDRRGRRVLWRGGGVNVTPGPIWMAHEWPMSAGVRV